MSMRIMTETTKPQDSVDNASRSGSRRQRLMLVRYGKMGFIGLFRHSEREISANATYVIMQTERGLEIGQIISSFCHQRGTCSIGPERIEQYCAANGSDYPLSRKGRIVRFATDQDINEHRHLENNAHQESRFCQELIEKKNLPMKLVTVEHVFGGDRIIYYFKAETRVDFRELVKELAHQYQTRIEMRQIGARDEARLVADFETCGRECCCKNFLKVLQPITMRMAKVQKATLDPAKISGRCGRLKCCLRYEDKVYTELAANLPRIGTNVTVEQGPGTIIDVHVLTQLVVIRLDSGAIVAVNVDEIIDRNGRQNATDRDQRGPAEKTPGNSGRSAGAQESASQPASGPDTPPAKKRRRRRKKKNKSGDGQSNPSAEGSGPSDSAPAPPPG